MTVAELRNLLEGLNGDMEVLLTLEDGEESHSYDIDFVGEIKDEDGTTFLSIGMSMDGDEDEEGEEDEE